jgi:Tol biopolymer transport system component
MTGGPSVRREVRALKRNDVPRPAWRVLAHRWAMLAAMGDESATRPAARTEPGSSRLDSWKEIAAYLGRGVRTVQRWEQEEGLPVHRLAHEKRGSIYARRDELDAWWESRRITLSAQPEPAADAAPLAPRLERVTWTTALTSWPALSSDAHLIAYVSDAGQDGTTPQIWIQQIGGAALRLTNGERRYSHLSFSPDNTRIIFTDTDDAGPSVYELPTLGGEPRLLQRGASRGCISPDGIWFACVPHNAAGIRISTRGGAGCRTVASEMAEVSCMTWSPDSRSVLVHARTDPALEPDWWIVSTDGGSPINTGVVRRFREAGMFTLPTGVAWVDDSLVFSAAGGQGVNLYRQRIMRSTFQSAGAPERLTSGGESAWLPTAAAGRLAYFSSRADMNLWSLALDAATGVAAGPLRRMTRGPFPLGFLTLTRDFQTLAYFSFRLGNGDVFLRDLRTGSESVPADGPPGAKGYPAISPSGSLLAYGTRMPGGARAVRPIYVAHLPDGTWRTLGDDCGGRPREWVDERRLVIERFGRLNSIALIDTETGKQCELLESAEQSISNPRLSPDRRWVAFDAAPPGKPARVFVSPFREEPIPESEWRLVDRSASHPFWSADGRLLYYTPAGTNPLLRSVIRARHVDAGSGVAEGEPIAVYASTEMLMPAYLQGTAPIATPDEIILVLGDFRGDIWLTDLGPQA